MLIREVYNGHYVSVSCQKSFTSVIVAAKYAKFDCSCYAVTFHDKKYWGNDGGIYYGYRRAGDDTYYRINPKYIPNYVIDIALRMIDLNHLYQ